MADAFVSSASEDRPPAVTLARAVEAHGWSVWWDRALIAAERADRSMSWRRATRTGP